MRANDIFTKKENQSQKFEIIFNNGIRAAISDAYCVNPDCKCHDVFLNFFEIGEDETVKSRLFSLTIDAATWTISKQNIENKRPGCERLIDEFMNDMDDVMKAVFSTRANEAKKQDDEYPINWFDELKPEDECCFGYAEVFGDRDLDKFRFAYEDVDYFVDDQYCANPDCRCNEVILTFIEIVPEKPVQEAKFVVRMPLNKWRYKVEYNQQLGYREIEKIYKCFAEHMSNDAGLLKKRYQKMKEFGKMRRARRIKARPVINHQKVGRNDLCPCGSGKKYKKCCGKLEPV